MLPEPSGEFPENRACPWFENGIRRTRQDERSSKKQEESHDRIPGIPGPHGGSRKALDQSPNGNDFWQTDYDAESNSYKMTFNLPLDGVDQSTWILAK